MNNDFDYEKIRFIWNALKKSNSLKLFHTCHVSSINVWHEMNIWTYLVGFQSFCNHQWTLWRRHWYLILILFHITCLMLSPVFSISIKIACNYQIGSSDTNIDNISNTFATVSLPFSGNDSSAEFSHMLQYCVHLKINRKRLKNLLPILSSYYAFSWPFKKK